MIQVRNTGTHFRFDADDNLWHAKVRIVETDTGLEQWHEFITQVATLVELLAWLEALFGGISARPDTHVRGT